MERKEYEEKNNEHAVYVKEKLHLYKQTLEFVKSGDVLQEFVQLKNNFQKLTEQVARLEEEIEEIKKRKSFVTVEEADREDESKLAEAEDPVNDELTEKEPIDFRKLSHLLKTTSLLELNEEEIEEPSNKQAFNFAKKEMPKSLFSRRDLISEGLNHSQSSNKHSMKVRGGKKVKRSN